MPWTSAKETRRLAGRETRRRRPGAAASARLAMAALICSLWPALAGAADAPVTSTIKEVTVDLAAHSVVQVLPFDVPFFMTGQAPPRTRQVSVRIIDVRTGGAGPAVLFPWDAESISETAVPFRILMPRLDAENYYRFMFDFRRTLVKDETDQIQRLAIPALEGVMRSLTLRDGQLDQRDSAALRDRLTAAVEQLIGPSRQIIVEATLFDRNTPHQDVLDQFNLAVREIIAPQEDRTDVVQGYGARQGDFRQPLDVIRNDAALDRVIGVIEASTDPTIVTALGQSRPGLDLARLDATQAGERANGTQPLERPTTPFTSIWATGEAGPYERNYRRTLADLEALRQVLEASLPVLPALPAADRSAVQALLAADGAILNARNLVNRLVVLMGRMRSDLDERSVALANLSTLVSVEARKLVVVDGTTVADFRTAQNWYISMDAGFAYAFRIGTLTPYVGANIYFRPVNKDAPLRLVDSFGRRFAFTFGITLSSIEEESVNDTALVRASRTRFDLMNMHRSLLLGVGFRVTQSLRLSGGALVLKEKDPNPLITTIATAAVPYIAFSLDFDVATGLKGGLGGLFGTSDNK
ncbi:MAG: hypothetical protein ABI868_05085 [Acidobacteriota bacterium]